MRDSYYIQHFARVNIEVFIFFFGIPIQKYSARHCEMLHYSQFTPFIRRVKHICLKSAQAPTPKAGV